MSAALSIVVNTTDAKAKTLRPEAITIPAPPACPSCDGDGVVDVSLPHQHPIERTCRDCDGTGVEPVALYEADDADSEQIHVFRTERAYFTDEPPVCGADVTDTSAHVVGRYPHCLECLAALDAWRER